MPLFPVSALAFFINLMQCQHCWWTVFHYYLKLLKWKLPLERRRRRKKKKAADLWGQRWVTHCGGTAICSLCLTPVDRVTCRTWTASSKLLLFFFQLRSHSCRWDFSLSIKGAKRLTGYTRVGGANVLGAFARSPLSGGLREVNLFLFFFFLLTKCHHNYWNLFVDVLSTAIFFFSNFFPHLKYFFFFFLIDRRTTIAAFLFFFFTKMKYDLL